MIRSFTRYHGEKINRKPLKVLQYPSLSSVTMERYHSIHRSVEQSRPLQKALRSRVIRSSNGSHHLTNVVSISSWPLGHTITAPMSVQLSSSPASPCLNKLQTLTAETSPLSLLRTPPSLRRTMLPSASIRRSTWNIGTRPPN